MAVICVAFKINACVSVENGWLPIKVQQKILSMRKINRCLRANSLLISGRENCMGWPKQRLRHCSWWSDHPILPRKTIAFHVSLLHTGSANTLEQVRSQGFSVQRQFCDACKASADPRSSWSRPHKICMPTFVSWPLWLLKARDGLIILIKMRSFTSGSTLTSGLQACLIASGVERGHLSVLWIEIWLVSLSIRQSYQALHQAYHLTIQIKQKLNLLSISWDVSQYSLPTLAFIGSTGQVRVITPS